MIVLPCQVKFAQLLELAQFLVLAIIGVTIAFDEETRNVYGNFIGVILLFFILFAGTNFRVYFLIKEMRAKSFAI